MSETSRRMEMHDVPRVLDLLAAAFGQMRYAELGRTFDRATVRQNLSGFVESPDCCCRVVTGNGKVIGALVMKLVTSLMDRGHTQAVELVWHAAPELSAQRRIRIMLVLWRDLVAEAEAMGARTLHVSVPAGDEGESLRHFLAKRGCRQAETVLVNVFK